MLSDELINNIETLSTDPTIVALCQELRLYRAFYVARTKLEYALNVASACLRNKVPPEQQTLADHNTANAMRAVEQSIYDIKNYQMRNASK